jgi:hypothetical protein
MSPHDVPVRGGVLLMYSRVVCQTPRLSQGCVQSVFKFRVSPCVSCQQYACDINPGRRSLYTLMYAVWPVSSDGCLPWGTASRWQTITLLCAPVFPFASNTLWDKGSCTEHACPHVTYRPLMLVVAGWVLQRGRYLHSICTITSQRWFDVCSQVCSEELLHSTTIWTIGK